MNSSDEYYIKNLNDIIIYVHKYILPVFYVISNIGNLIIVIIFFQKHWRKNVCVFYFQICLLFNSCYINSAVLGSIFIRGFNIHLQNSNNILCKLFFYVSFLFATLPPTVLILASIDRLLISSQNIDTRLYSSKRLAYFSISCCTLFWIVFHIHVLVKVNVQEIYPSYLICNYDSSKFYQDFVAYSSAVINSVFSLIMIILCIFALKNVHRIRAIPRAKRDHVRSMTKKDFQLLRCLFVQDIVYIIFGTLINADFLYEVITKDHMQTPLRQAIDTFLNNFVSFLYNASYSTSFFIFLIVSKAFRHELKRLVYKMFGQNLLVIREEENRQENIVRDNNIGLNVVNAFVLSV